MSCRLVAVGGLFGVLLLAGCGDGASSGTTSSAGTTSSVVVTTQPPPTLTAVAAASGPTMVTSAPVPITTVGGGATTVRSTPTTVGASPAQAVASGSTGPTSPVGATPTTVAATTGLVMRANGLGTVAFGTDPDTTIAAITAALGPPTLDTGWMDPLSLGSCPGTEVRSVQFGDLALHFGDESTVTIGRPHFFAYVDGPATGAPTDAGVLTIDGGGSVGTTVAALRAAHPALQVYPADPTAPASFAISDGLTGVLTGTTDGDTVTKVQGGIGCGE